MIEAQANKAGVLAQIEGFRSEQLTNENALIKEKNDLVNSGIEADTERALNQKEFQAEQEETELARLEKQKENLELERKIEQERLQLKVNSYAEGTQARADAETELKDKLQEIDQEITTNSKAQGDARNEINKKEAQVKKDNLDKQAVY